MTQQDIQQTTGAFFEDNKRIIVRVLERQMGAVEAAHQLAAQQLQEKDLKDGEKILLAIMGLNPEVAPEIADAFSSTHPLKDQAATWAKYYASPNPS